MNMDGLWNILRDVVDNKEARNSIEETARVIFTSDNISVNLIPALIILALLALLPLIKAPLLGLLGGGLDGILGGGSGSGGGSYLPDTGYGAPSAGYGAPDAGYGAPDAGYGAPAPGYESSYSARSGTDA